MTQPLREASPREVRARIDAIPPEVTIPAFTFPNAPEKNTYTRIDMKAYRGFFEIGHFGLRASELCFPNVYDFTRAKYPIDGVEPLRASDLSIVTLDMGKLPMRLRIDLSSWLYVYIVQGDEDRAKAIMREFFSSEYEGICLNVRTEKRDGYTRQVVIPREPRFEPWAPLIEETVRAGHHSLPEDKLLRIPEAKRKSYMAEDYVFPFDRNQALRVANVIFQGLGYSVVERKVYQTDESGKLVKDEKDKPILEGVVEAHLKPYGLHASRHGAESMMEREYGFSPYDTESLLGHQHKDVSAMRAVYGNIPDWELYFPKMILTKMLERDA